MRSALSCGNRAKVCFLSSYDDRELNLHFRYSEQLAESLIAVESVETRRHCYRSAIYPQAHGQGVVARGQQQGSQLPDRRTDTCYFPAIHDFQGSLLCCANDERCWKRHRGKGNAKSLIIWQAVSDHQSSSSTTGCVASQISSRTCLFVPEWGICYSVSNGWKRFCEYWLTSLSHCDPIHPSYP